MWTLGQNQPQQVGVHEAPVKTIFWINEVNLLATGSWDKTIRYWDLRSASPALQVTVPERIYCMDVTHPLMVVGLGGDQKNILVYNLNNPQTPFKTMTSTLQMQTRCIGKSIFLPAI